MIGGLRMPKLPPNPLVAVLRRLAGNSDHVLRHVHELKETLMATKDEVLAQIADVKAVLVETGKDVNRVADKLDQAVANGDLSEVSAAVAELHQLASAIDTRAEAADPEPAEEATPSE